MIKYIDTLKTYIERLHVVSVEPSNIMHHHILHKRLLCMTNSVSVKKCNKFRNVTSSAWARKSEYIVLTMHNYLYNNLDLFLLFTNYFYNI